MRGWSTLIQSQRGTTFCSKPTSWSAWRCPRRLSFKWTKDIYVSATMWKSDCRRSGMLGGSSKTVHPNVVIAHGWSQVSSWNNNSDFFFFGGGGGGQNLRGWALTLGRVPLQRSELAACHLQQDVYQNNTFLKGPVATFLANRALFTIFLLVHMWRHSIHRCEWDTGSKWWTQIPPRCEKWRSEAVTPNIATVENINGDCLPCLRVYVCWRMPCPTSIHVETVRFFAVSSW